MNSARIKNAEVSAHFNGAGYAVNTGIDSEACSIVSSDCYQARVVPTVVSISESGGWNSGGQMITITGTSLDSTADRINVTVDGEHCLLQSANQTSIVC